MIHRHAGPQVRYRTRRGNIKYRDRPTHSQMDKFKSLKYNKLRKRFNINPILDDDKDGVKNYQDCRPWDKKKQGQSLFHAGDEPPSELIKRGEEVYGFSDYDSAEAWKDKMGYEKVYQFHTDDFDLDEKQYIRDRKGKKVMSDDEYIARDVLTEKEVND